MFVAFSESFPLLSSFTLFVAVLCQCLQSPFTAVLRNGSVLMNSVAQLTDTGRVLGCRYAVKKSY